MTCAPVLPLLVLAFLVGAAAPAAAHGPPADDRYYRAAVTEIGPHVDGVTAEVARDGSWVRVRNTTSTPLVVLGYDGEPYLRVGPAGAEENVASVTSLVNGEYGSGVVTRDAPAGQAARAPRWEPRGLEPVVTWHDVRTHYTGSGRPPAVRDAPERAHRLATWHLRAVYGDRPLVVTGTLDWTGRPGAFTGTTSEALWAAAALSALVCVVLVVRTFSPRRSSTAASATPTRRADPRSGSRGR